MIEYVDMRVSCDFIVRVPLEEPVEDEEEAREAASEALGELRDDDLLEQVSWGEPEFHDQKPDFVLDEDGMLITYREEVTS